MSDASPRLRPTIAIVPLPAIEISGSLSPSARNSSVLVKVRLPIDVLPNVTSAATTETPRIAPSHLIVLPFNLGFIPSESHRLGSPATEKKVTRHLLWCLRLAFPATKKQTF